MLPARKKRRAGPSSNPTSCNLLLAQEFGFSTGKALRQLRHEYLSRQPSLLQATRSFQEAENTLNKAFCCAWQDADNVLVGTKCNTFLQINVPTRSHKIIPLPPQPICRTGPDLFTSYTSMEHQAAGIHSIAVSPCGRYVATGGKCVNDAVVFRADTMTPVQTFMGHADWVFGISFLTSTHFVTASRDCTIKLWQLQDDGSGCYKPEPASCLASVFEHKDKVRDVYYNAGSQRLLSMCVNGEVALWTPDLQLIQKLDCPRSLELVACSMSGSVVAVGSKYHITLFDTRAGSASSSSSKAATGADALMPRTDSKGVFAEIESTVHGVRSVVFQDYLMSHGTGDGQLHFHDMRYLRHPVLRRRLHDESASWGALPQHVHSLTIQPGHVGPWDDDWPVWFDEVPRHIACYSHAWDPSGTKLFTAGGPLACGMRGCSLMLWE